MLSVRRSEDRGHAYHGWLDTHYTFSFADYRDPDFVHFSALRVINQDRIAAGKGFPTHGHADMEIVTYVLDGVLEHRDSMGHGSLIRPGDVQLMSAGSGVTHSEFNASKTEPVHLLQMWVMPGARGTEPRYEQRSFPEAERRGRLRLVVSPDGRDGSLTILQDARMYAGVFEAGDETELALGDGRCAWLHVGSGRVRVNGEALGPGDGVAIRDERSIELVADGAADVVLWELPDAG